MEIRLSHQPESMAISDALESVIRTVLNKTAEVYDLTPQTEVSILLTDNATIQSLNCQYRGKDMPTDVLSFALNEANEPEIIDGPPENLLGDIVISLEKAREQAEEYGHSQEREVAFLTLHGLLHLLGYNHETENDKAEMRREEEYVLSLLGISR